MNFFFWKSTKFRSYVKSYVVWLELKTFNATKFCKYCYLLPQWFFHSPWQPSTIRLTFGLDKLSNIQKQLHTKVNQRRLRLLSESHYQCWRPKNEKVVVLSTRCQLGQHPKPIIPNNNEVLKQNWMRRSGIQRRIMLWGNKSRSKNTPCNGSEVMALKVTTLRDGHNEIESIIRLV